MYNVVFKCYYFSKKIKLKKYFLKKKFLEIYLKKVLGKINKRKFIPNFRRGGSKAVKCGRLKICYLSGFAGSNPVPRIL